MNSDWIPIYNKPNGNPLGSKIITVTALVFYVGYLEFFNRPVGAFDVFIIVLLSVVAVVMLLNMSFLRPEGDEDGEGTE